MRVEWVRGRGLHKDIALMLRFSVCMYQHLFRDPESTFNARHVLAHIVLRCGLPGSGALT